jgi:hypothetical protein
MLPALGPSFDEGLPQAQAEPGVFGRRRVCRRRRPKDPPHVGRGIYRRSHQPGQSCGEFNTHCGDRCRSDIVLKCLGHSDT